MTYSLVGLLAIVIHLIINFDVFLDFKAKRKFKGEKFYLFFLFSVIAFHITDAAWGFLNDAKLSTALFVDTTIYFVAMATSILMWGIFLYYYLGFEKKKNKAILYVDFVVFAYQIIIIIINIFWRVLFDVSGECVYSAKPLRYLNLSVQILMYLLLSIYTFYSSTKVKDSTRRKHLTVGMFGLFMIASITTQVFFPLLPLYSLGYLFGLCVLHTFVFRDVFSSEQKELEETKHRVLVDALTGVYSKHAYTEVEEKIEANIENGTVNDFAMVVFDLNDLKLTNDTYGHEVGDNYLIDSTKLILEYFNKIPLYRIGGDEFVAILTKQNYEDRNFLIKRFNERIDENLRKKDRLIISCGCAAFNHEQDTTIVKVFARADRAMYARKQELKSREQK